MFKIAVVSNAASGILREVNPFTVSEPVIYAVIPALLVGCVPVKL